MKKLLIGIVATTLVIVAGIATLPMWLPKIILYYTLNSLPNDEQTKTWVKNKIILIVFDEKTEKSGILGIFSLEKRPSKTSDFSLAGF